MTQKKLTGLSTKEAEARLLKYGKNLLSSGEDQNLIHAILRFFKDPMGLMMLGLSLIYFLLGETKEAVIMLIAFIPISLIDVLLELKSEKALSALRATFPHTAKVIRDGIVKEISISEIVQGDLLALEEGQTVPADGVILSVSNLTLSEASLTGESIPIEKELNEEIFAGTSVLSGNALVEVNQTGLNTKFGKIVKLLENSETGISPLQLKVNLVVKQIIKIAIGLIVLLFLLEIFRGKSILQSLLISLTFGMASVPEEFPLVFTMYLSLGAFRLAKRGVLVKSLPSVETLGSVNVICTDKTGTLTEGNFQLNDFIFFNQKSSEENWLMAILACEPVIVDSMEKAIKHKMPSTVDYSEWKLIYDYPFEKEGKHMGHAYQNNLSEGLVVIKGAVEGVIEHCQDSIDFKKAIINKAEELSAKGFRLLGLAGKRGEISGKRESDESNLNFIGILAFIDPIRVSAKNAIEICQKEGIQVKMITGDHRLTAHAIAEQLGLEHDHNAMYSGEELKKLTIEEKQIAFKKGAIFSRVTPEQKYELVKALKAEGMVVAMTGDGINDAPALKIADIGISMGENATDTARETAKMVLTNSDFNGIVYAIMEGRRIFLNLKMSFSYLISFHVPVVLLSFIPPLLNLGDVIKPIHIILLEMIVHPVSAFAFENLEHERLKVNQSIMDKKTLLTAALAGILLSILALFVFFFHFEMSLVEKRTFAFSSILFGNIGFILLETWPKFSKRLIFIFLMLFSLTILLISSTFLTGELNLSPISPDLITISLLIGLAASFPSFIIRRI